jgi:hypothetical protein
VANVITLHMYSIMKLYLNTLLLSLIITLLLRIRSSIVLIYLTPFCSSNPFSLLEVLLAERLPISTSI